MKRVLTLLVAAGFIVSVASLVFTSCTKEGPQGPPGADGQDANATCTQCHDFTDDIVAKIFQYDASQHATGSTTFESAKNCAPCHTSQGFEEVAQTLADTTTAAIEDAAPINCRTCHVIHTTYTAADWGFRTVAPVTLRIQPHDVLDLPVDGGIGNLCARCHQPRARTPWPTPGGKADSMNITSIHWGPHYGCQSVILAGMGAFEGVVPGTPPFENSPHRNVATCPTCHMASAVGNVMGGHTLWMASEDEGDNVAGCKQTDCHPNATDFDIDGKQTEIEELFQQLEDLLLAAGFLDESLHIKPGKYAQNDLCVIWNWFLVEYDRSMGVHNYKYTRDNLLQGINHMNSRKSV